MIQTEKPIFIVGVHRSGTTLLRYMLNSHPRIYIPPESDFIPRFFLRNPQQRISLEKIDYLLQIIFTQYRFVREWKGPELTASDFPGEDLSPNEFLDFIYHTYALQNGAVRWGDKTPIYSSYIPLLSELFPQSQIIHLIRDGRDVALSMLEKWGKNEFHVDIYFCAKNWIQRIQHANCSGEYLGNENYLALHYEDLVANPEFELKKVCKFLNEDYFSVMAHPHLLARKNIEPGSFHEPLREPPSTKHVTRWQVEMEPRDLYLFQHLAGYLLEQLDYPLHKQVGPSFEELFFQYILAVKYHFLQFGRKTLTALGLKPPI